MSEIIKSILEELDSSGNLRTVALKDAESSLVDLSSNDLSRACGRYIASRQFPCKRGGGGSVFGLGLAAACRQAEVFFVSRNDPFAGLWLPRSAVQQRISCKHRHHWSIRGSEKYIYHCRQAGACQHYRRYKTVGGAFCPLQAQ